MGYPIGSPFMVFLICVMFLGVPPVISTLGNPQGKYFLFRRGDGPSTRKKQTPIWEPPKSISIHPQLYSHSLTWATLNRYSRIYDAGGFSLQHRRGRESWTLEFQSWSWPSSVVFRDRIGARIGCHRTVPSCHRTWDIYFHSSTVVVVSRGPWSFSRGRGPLQSCFVTG